MAKTPSDLICPDCQQKVIYVPVIVVAAYGKKPKRRPGRTTKVVYLTCPNGHVHPYTVTAETES